jgi:hypothetical protein
VVLVGGLLVRWFIIIIIIVGLCWCCECNDDDDGDGEDVVGGSGLVGFRGGSGCLDDDDNEQEGVVGGSGLVVIVEYYRESNLVMREQQQQYPGMLAGWIFVGTTPIQTRAIIYYSKASTPH